MSFKANKSKEDPTAKTKTEIITTGKRGAGEGRRDGVTYNIINIAEIHFLGATRAQRRNGVELLTTRPATVLAGGGV